MGKQGNNQTLGLPATIYEQRLVTWRGGQEVQTWLFPFHFFISQNSTGEIKKRQASRKGTVYMWSCDCCDNNNQSKKSDSDHEIFSKRLMIIEVKSAEDDDHIVLGQVSGKGWINRWACLLTWVTLWAWWWWWNIMMMEYENDHHNNVRIILFP